MIHHLKINGKQRPFLFAWGAIREMADDNELKEANTYARTEIAAYYGFKRGAIAEGKEIDFTKEDVALWFDTNFKEMVKVGKFVREAYEVLNEKTEGAGE